ncbi:MAG: protein kinase family protein [bacterium]|nr:protein kinase family protein [bacterium]
MAGNGLRGLGAPYTFSAGKRPSSDQRRRSDFPGQRRRLVIDPKPTLGTGPSHHSTKRYEDQQKRTPLATLKSPAKPPSGSFAFPSPSGNRLPGDGSLVPSALPTWGLRGIQDQLQKPAWDADTPLEDLYSRFFGSPKEHALPDADGSPRPKVPRLSASPVLTAASAAGSEAPVPGSQLVLIDPKGKERPQGQPHTFSAVPTDVTYVDDVPQSPPAYRVLTDEHSKGLLSSAQKQVIFDSGGNSTLGEGAFGTVFRAQSTRALCMAAGHSKTDVAIKRSKVSKSDFKINGQRRTIMPLLMASVKSPYLNLPIISGRDHQGRELEVFPLMRGNLNSILPGIYSHIRQIDPKSELAALHILITALQHTAKGLDFMHTCENGTVVHRDLKPDNILLGDELIFKISDFGCAISEESLAAGCDGDKGAQWYASPEASRISARPNRSIDIFSLGMIIVEFLALGNPNPKVPEAYDEMLYPPTLTYIVEAAKGEEPEAIKQALNKIARLCLMDPRERPTAKALAEAMESLLPEKARKDARVLFSRLLDTHCPVAH